MMTGHLTHEHDGKIIDGVVVNKTYPAGEQLQVKYSYINHFAVLPSIFPPFASFIMKYC